MTCPRDVFRARAILDSKDSLGDHLARVRADDVHAEHAVGLRLGNELDDTLGVEVRLRARVGREGELADIVLDTGSLELLLGLADPSDLGVRVDNRGNGIIVNVAVTSLDILSNSNTCKIELE